MFQTRNCKFRTLLLLLALVLVVAGCRSWLEPKSAPSKAKPLQQFRMPADSVVLEVVVAEFPEEQMQALSAAMRPYLDQQEVKVSERQAWSKNGFVIGSFHSTWPSDLRDALTKPKTLEESGDNRISWDELQSINAKPTVVSHQKLQFRTGEPRDIFVSNFLDVARWKVVGDDAEQDERTVNNARGWFKVIATLSRGTSIGLTIVPKVSFGDTRQQIGVVDEGLAFQLKQNEFVYSNLPSHIELSPGETVVIYADSQIGELGDLLLGSGNSLERSGSRLVLMRLVHTQHDDLFGLSSLH